MLLYKDWSGVTADVVAMPENSHEAFPAAKYEWIASAMVFQSVDGVGKIVCVAAE